MHYVNDLLVVVNRSDQLLVIIDIQTVEECFNFYFHFFADFSAIDLIVYSKLYRIEIYLDSDHSRHHRVYVFLFLRLIELTHHKIVQMSNCYIANHIMLIRLV